MKPGMDSIDRGWHLWMENNLEHESKCIYVQELRTLGNRKDGTREEDAEAEDEIEHESADADDSENGLKLFLEVTDDTMPFEPKIKALEYARGARFSDLETSKSPTSPNAWINDRRIVTRRDGKEAADEQGDDRHLLRKYKNKGSVNASDLFKALKAPVSLSDR
jgi:hypothetical protein